jgi:regulator of cell morphogenesis and NO signaling
MSIQDPIAHLLDEHADIMAQVEGLRRAVRDLEERGDAAVESARPELEAVGNMMATQLSRHARKEDEALFPALEEILGFAGTPTAVMRMEHRQIHAEAERFRATLRELHEVEHPAIVAGGERLRSLSAHGGAAEQLRDTGAEICRLLDLHFGKEEDILFPMARQLLDEQAMATVARRMESMADA